MKKLLGISLAILIVASASISFAAQMPKSPLPTIKFTPKSAKNLTDLPQPGYATFNNYDHDGYTSCDIYGLHVNYFDNNGNLVSQQTFGDLSKNYAGSIGPLSNDYYTVQLCNSNNCTTQIGSNGLYDFVYYPSWCSNTTHH